MITLFDRKIELCNEWSKSFDHVKEVEIYCGDFRDMPTHNIIITAGNSYGIMNGGIDLAMRDYFGIEIQDAIQWGIVQHYGGCMPVGCGLQVATSNDRFPTLMYVPTMITPRQIVPADIFACFYSVLKAVKHLVKDENIACCGLGTGVGGVSHNAAAKNMRAAYDAAMNSI